MAGMSNCVVFVSVPWSKSSRRISALTSPTVALRSSFFAPRFIPRIFTHKRCHSPFKCAHRPDVDTSLPTTSSLTQETSAPDVLQIAHGGSVWKNPTWLRIHAQRLALASEQLSWKPVIRHSRAFHIARILCSSISISLIALLYHLHAIYNRSIISWTSAAALTTAQRTVSVDRVVRCNPLTGIRLSGVQVHASSSPNSELVLDAKHVDLFLTGFFQYIWDRSPFKLNISCTQPMILVSEHAKATNDGLITSEWILGDSWPTFNTTQRTSKTQSSSLSLLNYLQPGHIRVTNAFLRLRSAVIEDYGHGGEEATVLNVNAVGHTPNLKVDEGSRTPITVGGPFKAVASGNVVGGGSINVELNVSSISQNFSEIEAKLQVDGRNLAAPAVSTVLNLPFRTDEGSCSGKIDIDFSNVGPGEIPKMTGDALLTNVGIRFHPDPKTPELQEVNGKLRFEGKRLFFDGPTGLLGSIPLSVLGNIHLEDGYELTGYARQVDMNEIVETFKLDNFLPLEGDVVGEVEMTGELEEPFISGIVKTAGSRLVLDRLPVKCGEFTFEWDASAGILKFPSIKTEPLEGGVIEGNGSIFFDMTAQNEFGIFQERHHIRNPKSMYWNEDGNQELRPVPHLPRDEFEVDEMAPIRPYDSMLFYFTASGLSGESLLVHFGGEYGLHARKALGSLEGECVIAGHAKDGNCRVSWRSTSDPPKTQLDLFQLKANEGVSSTTGNHESSSFHNLGGGMFKGLTYLKLGDLPEARRIRCRTIVKGLDARRLAWSIPELRMHLFEAPLLNMSMDTYFTGILTQKRLLPTRSENRYQSRRMELLGADGALAVRSLSVNNLSFDSTMSGSFSFSKSDISLSLKRLNYGGKLASSASSQIGGSKAAQAQLRSNNNKSDEIALTGSVKGDVSLRLKRADLSLRLDVSPRNSSRQPFEFSISNLNIQDITGGDYHVGGSLDIGGTITAMAKGDVAKNIGEGNIFIQYPRVGSVLLSSVKGRLALRDKQVLLKQAVARYHGSTYKVHGDCQFGSTMEETAWKMTVDIPQANAQEVARVVNGAYSTFNIIKAQNVRRSSGRIIGSNEWSAFSKRPKSYNGSGEILWEVPQHLSSQEQLDWYLQSREDGFPPDIDTVMDLNLTGLSSLTSSTSKLEGNLGGQLSISYEPSSIASKNQRSGGFKDPLISQLDRLSDFKLSFDLKGEDLSLGGVEITAVNVKGNFDNDSMEIGPLTINGKAGYDARAQLRITTAGILDGLVSLNGVPVELLRQTGVLPIDVVGACDGRVSLGGTLSNPKALGRLIWREAAVSRRRVNGGKFDIACFDGRCVTDISGKVSARPKNSVGTIRTEREWADNLQDVARLLKTRVSRQSLTPGNAKGSNNLRTLFNVYIDAPVQFYLDRALRGLSPESDLNLGPGLRPPSLTGLEEVYINADISKFGLAFLQSAIPSWQWEKGDAEIHLCVSGNVSQPRISGSVQIKDGHFWPPGLSAPVSSLRGNIKFVENGLIRVSDLSGRCERKGFTVKGDMFVSSEYRNEVIRRREEIQEDHKVRLAEKQRKDREYYDSVSKLSLLKSSLSRGDEGLQIDIAEMPLRMKGYLQCRLSGRIRVKGVAQEPLVSGYINVYDGAVSLASSVAEPGKKYINEATTDIVRKESIFEKEQDSASENRADSPISNQNSVVKGGVQSVVSTGDQNQESALSEDGVLDKHDVMSGSTEVPPLNTGDGFRVRFDNFRLNCGKGMKVVYPYFLNFETTGRLSLNGNGETPQITGRLDLVRGNLNVLPSRLSLLPYERSYVLFAEDNASKSDGVGSPSEPRLKISLESDSGIFRVSECPLSSWSDHLTVSDKIGSNTMGSWWGKLLVPGSGNPGASVKKSLTSIVTNLLSLSGKLFGLQWSVFATPVSSSENRFKLREDAGVGIGVDSRLGKIVAKRSIGGSTGLRLYLPFFKWFTIALEQEGNLLSFHLQSGEPKN